MNPNKEQQEGSGFKPTPEQIKDTMLIQELTDSFGKFLLKEYGPVLGVNEEKVERHMALITSSLPPHLKSKASIVLVAATYWHKGVVQGVDITKEITDLLAEGTIRQLERAMDNATNPFHN